MRAGAFWFILRANNYDCELSKLTKNMKTMHTTSHLQSHLHMALYRYRDDHYHIHTNRICERNDHYRISAKKWSGFGLTYRTGSAGPELCTDAIIYMHMYDCIKGVSRRCRRREGMQRT